jgi:hypothetical protein
VARTGTTELTSLEEQDRQELLFPRLVSCGQEAEETVCLLLILDSIMEDGVLISMYHIVLPCTCFKMVLLKFPVL